MTGREARLKEEFAAEYPGIAPEVWIPVAELARKLVERVHQRRKLGHFTRTFDPTHFEFRGGEEKLRSRTTRTRSTDPKRHRVDFTPTRGDPHRHEVPPTTGS